MGHWALCKQPKSPPKPKNQPPNPKGQRRETPAQPPCGYVIVPLKGIDGDECTLAFRADNLYLVAFANGKKEWFVFKRHAHLFPSATVLDFDNDYYSLMGGTAADMAPKYQLGRWPSLQAIKEICRYQKGPPGSETGYIKLALATMVLTIPEAKRFTPIRQTIVKGWETGTSLNTEQAKYLVNWKQFSCCVLYSEKKGVWGCNSKDTSQLNDNLLPTDKQGVLDVVDILLQPTQQCSY